MRGSVSATGADDFCRFSADVPNNLLYIRAKGHHDNTWAAGLRNPLPASPMDFSLHVVGECFLMIALVGLIDRNAMKAIPVLILLFAFEGASMAAGLPVCEKIDAFILEATRISAFGKPRKQREARYRKALDRLVSGEKEERAERLMKRAVHFIQTLEQNHYVPPDWKPGSGKWLPTEIDMAKADSEAMSALTDICHLEKRRLGYYPEVKNSNHKRESDARSKFQRRVEELLRK